MKGVRLGSETIGDGYPCYCVAEIGGLFKNFEEAKRLIDVAIEIGINAVKFQTLEAETITTKNNYFDLGVTGKVLQYDFFKKFELPKELQRQIVKYANKKGITIFSAPSHIQDLELMKQMELPIYKIGSDLACHIPLLKQVAKLEKPIILSTGMCTLKEVKESVNAILSSGNDQLILLHCVSDYPAKIEESNLNAINTLKEEFNLPVGYSDHTIGPLTSLTAAAMGANMIEKHFRHPENSSAADDPHALTPNEFEYLVSSIRKIERAKGTGEKKPSLSEAKNMLNNRVSIVAITNIPAGTIITKEMIDIRRPETGMAPKFFDEIIGKKAVHDILQYEPILTDMFT